MAPILMLLGVLFLLNTPVRVNGEYSSFGAEFYIAAARNYQGIAQYLNVTVSTTSASPVPFILETSSGVIHTGATTFSNPQTITVSTDLMVLDSTYENRHKGIHVYSTNGYPISVILLNFEPYTIGEYLALPCNQPSQPEYEYFVPSTSTNPGNPGIQSQVLLVGCDNNSNITIFPTQTIHVPQDINNPTSVNIEISAGLPYDITLHQMQTFLFSSLVDLSGTRIVSSNPLTVISGHECGNVPVDAGYCEHLTVQIPPTTTLGQTFLLIPFAGRTGGQYFKAITSRSDTTLNFENCNSTSGSNVSLTNVGDSFEFWTSSNSFCALFANKPIVLVQLSPGSQVDGTGDPTICLVPSTEQFVNKLAFVSLPDEFQNQFVSIGVQAQFFDKQSIFLDGKLLNSTWNAIKGKTGAIIGYATRHEVTGGSTHTIYHEDSRAGLGVVIYGFSQDQSFTYNGGLQLISTTEFAAVLTLKPWYGSNRGGTVVLVSGPSFGETDEIMCKFNGVVEYGIVISELYAACTSPPLSTTGRVPFQLYVNNELHKKDAVFYSMPRDSEYSVDIMNTETILHFAEEEIVIAWSNVSFYPPEFNVLSDELDAEVILQQVNPVDGSTSVIKKWMLPNTGKAALIIPNLSDYTNSAIPAEIVVNARPKTSRKRNIVVSLVRSALYTAIRYVASSAALRIACEAWSSTQGAIGNDILDRVDPYPCPSRLDQITRDNSGFQEDFVPSDKLPTTFFDSAWRNFFHPGSAVCYRQSVGFDQTQGSGNQCCYKKDGTLNVGPDGGGTVDLYSPSEDFWGHQLHDVLPFVLCCKGLFSNCAEYYRHRPSDDGSRFMPDPPACVYGDPHIVTLDLHKYTFNGKGEFTLIEVEDGSFTIQGRMVEATGADNDPVSATVFSAIAIKENSSDTIQFQLSVFKGIVVLVNGEEVDFSELKEQKFTKVVVADLGDNTLTAAFANGASIKIKEENSIISVLIISLPRTFKGKTQGLMGNFDGDQSDDLKPKDKPAISLSSSMQDIHNFGLTWIISRSEDSIFSYEGSQFWSSFYEPSFTPVFEPTFASVEVEQQAKEMCKNDSFCLFDIAATGRVDIGLSTLSGSIEFERIVKLSTPVSCNPPCKNGACVANDVCSCSQGYVGPRCEQIVYEECDENPCMNGGECLLHASTYICNCKEAYSGYFCQDQFHSIAGVLVGTILATVALIIVLLIALLVVYKCIRKKRSNYYKQTQHSRF
jgi:hypothetical protein